MEKEPFTRFRHHSADGEEVALEKTSLIKLTSLLHDLARVARASNVGTIWTRSSYACDLEDGVDDAADAFSGDESTSDGEAVNLEALGVTFGPEVGRDGSNYHSSSVYGPFSR